MSGRELPSPELLRKLLRYEASTGNLFWRERPPEMFPGRGRGGARAEALRWNIRLAGKSALHHTNPSGYRGGRIQGVHVVTQRVIWAIEHGVWPAGEVDHIDGDLLNNRLANLRLVTTRENCRNRSLRSDNKSGVNGVRWNPQKGKWTAEINIGGRNKKLGAWADKSDAIAARRKDEALHGYHPNHGRPKPQTGT